MALGSRVHSLGVHDGDTAARGPAREAISFSNKFAMTGLKYCTNFTLATVSTGWKIRSSDTPATAAPIIRAGPLPPPPLGALVATTAGWWFIDVRMLMVFATEAALRRGWIAVVSGGGLRRRKARAQVKQLSSESSAAALAGVKLTLSCEDVVRKTHK